ncbi:unnamed protein product [Ilex paraguariensis]|uniref:RNase H type-1 domain-containing protein n=1 Tax=Ilex paraguariensis TaxID=185542 RepID=A0ABC8RWN0_9AQUA
MATSTRRVEQTNTDGSAQGNPGPTGVGGLIEDTSGSFIAGFKGDTGRSTSLVAELRALREGFRMAEMLQIPKLTINFDAQVTKGTVLGGEDKAGDAGIQPVC